MEAKTGTGRRALVVDDERDLASLIADYLGREGFTTTCAFDGTSAVKAAREQAPDLVILDLGLPGMDGVEVCREIRTFSDCFVVMVTARSDEVDTLIGLSVGADDYMTKPFSPRELVARTRVLFRRPRTSVSPAPPTSDGWHYGDLDIDPQAREVSIAGSSVHVTKIEFDILATLAAHPRQVFTRRALIGSVWGGSWVGDEHLVDVHILNLRRKLGDNATTQRYVRTSRGTGYRMGEG